VSFTPSPEQARAIAAISDWYVHGRGDQQVFRLFGYAGSGKTTLTGHAIADLGLEPMDRTGGSGGVLYGAFTGKAALVMTRKGAPASTIHGLIYRCSEATPAEIGRVEQDLKDLKASLDRMDPGESAFAETRR
jgi:AAA domain-containing protein